MKKRYVIVGASKGIGNVIAGHLSDEGHDIIAFSRSSGDLGGIANVDLQAYDVAGDTDFPEVSGAVDGLVYCPGTINLKPFHRLSDEDFLADFNVNLMGAVRAIRTLLPNLKDASTPSIVFFSTVAVQTGMGFHASVAAAKGAVEGLTRALASEFAPKIRVNCIAPSLTDTPLAEKLLNTPEKRESSAARHPLKKIGTAEDIASMAEFLLSEKSGWITGQIFHVDGGMSSIR